MSNVPDSLLGRMYRQHIQFILDKNIDGLLGQYTEDCLLISSFQRNAQGVAQPLYYRGKVQLREHMNGILGIDGLQTSIAFWAETDTPQTLMIVEEITMKTKDGDARMRFADSWVLRDGKIAVHFAGMTQYPDGAVA